MLIGTLTRSLHRYLFDPIEKKGTILLLNRFEFLLTAILALALMVATAYLSSPWDPHNRYRYLAVAAIILGILAFAKNRRIMLGIALAIVTARLLIGGLMLGKHLLLAIGSTAISGALSWLLLKDYR